MLRGSLVSRASLFLFLLWQLVCLDFALSAETAVDTEATMDLAANTSETEHHDEEEEEEEPAFAVLFAPFTMTIGTLVFFVLSRYLKALPYTAVMFLVGTLMGITSSLSGHISHLSETVDMWVSINSEVLLLVFLPGLIFKDAFGLDVYLFLYAFSQLLIFAFPLVLVGTSLGALIGYYIFPFGWSFNLAMTVGSILAATDPVAVAALLEEVGAPPRMKIHIAGESLLNDGSAIVFFSIFSERYYSEFGIEGVGEDVDLKKGIGMFCQKALGGAAIGLFFAIALLGCLLVLNRRFSREENVVQVTAIFGVAYLNYYVADFVWKTSGVMATVSAGVFVKLLGRAMVNDLKLLEDFLTLVEHILNTVLFTLGGAVWGAVIATGERDGTWTAKEWGYLLVLYIGLHVIRAAQFVLTYPITSRIGLKTNWAETAFQVFGGLRGALGITLGIALDNKVSFITGGNNDTIDEIHTQQAVGMIGGIAFLTLVFNGVTAGPFLRKLGLADSSTARQRIVQAYRYRFRAALIDEMVRLLCQHRFRNVNFAQTKYHVPYLADLTKTQLLQAVEKHKSTVPPEEYVPPNLVRILPYVIDDATGPRQQDMREVEEQLLRELEAQQRNARLAKRVKERRKGRNRVYSTSNLRYMMEADFMSAQELRILFISILRATYENQIEHGELDDAHILAVTLNQSLDMALDAVSNGQTLKDWDYLNQLYQPLEAMATRLKHFGAKVMCNKSMASKFSHLGLKSGSETMYIERSISFMAAHKAAQAAFMMELQDADSELTEAAKVVMEESKKQYDLADAAIKVYDEKTRELAISHKFCKILLTMSIHYVDKLVKVGLLKETEAEPLVEEIEEHLDHLISCELTRHPGENEKSSVYESDMILEEDGGDQMEVDPILGNAMEEGFEAEAIQDPAVINGNGEEGEKKIA